MALVSTIRSRAKEPDQACADAFDLARRSLVEDAQVSADTIGDYLATSGAGPETGSWVRVWKRDITGRWRIVFETSTPS